SSCNSNVADHLELAAEPDPADQPSLTSAVPTTPDRIAPLGSSTAAAPFSDSSTPHASNLIAATAPRPGRRRNRPHRARRNRQGALRA
ncbi:MAG TPA: hypothetical protein VNC50_07400, partial [Planctomycetia bacterium]|nr:hypothetical protein [Planctomycetia bacterium]